MTGFNASDPLTRPTSYKMDLKQVTSLGGFFFLGQRAQECQRISRIKIKKAPPHT